MTALVGEEFEGEESYDDDNMDILEVIHEDSFENGRYRWVCGSL